MFIGTPTALALLLPLLLSVAVIYKTVRLDDLRRLPMQVLMLMLYMIGGLGALAVGLWALHTFWPL
jgi:hypothetical protein